MNPFEWADLGVPVFPCRYAPDTPKHNSPLCEYGVKAATINREQIAEWWNKWPDASPGLACGIEFDVIDLDIDKKTGEAVGEEYLRKHFPDAWGRASIIVKTPSGGRHLFYRPGARLKNYVRSLPGIDVRTHGGYVVGVGAPGYEFFRGGPEELATLYSPPESIITALNAKRKAREEAFPEKPTAGPVEITPERKRYADSAFERECKEVREMPEGGRNARLNTAAFNLGTLVGAGALDESKVISELSDAALDAGLSKDEIRKTIRSGLSTGKKKPRDLSRIREAVNVDDFLERFVYVANDDLVADLDAPGSLPPLPLKNFHNRYAHLFTETVKKAPTVKDPDRVVPTDVKTTLKWLESDKQSVEGQDYHPAKDRLMTCSKGLGWLNTYQPPEWIDDEVGEVPSEIHTLLKTLAPEEADRDLLIRWMALTVHRPERRSPIIPLIITPAQGVGKGLLAVLLKGLVGASNLSKPKMPALFESFHDYLVNTTLAVVDEAAETSDKRSKYVALDGLRDTLTEPDYRINEKHEKGRTRNVYTNFLFLSNHENALILDDDDRRMFVIISDHPPHPDEFYNRVWPLVIRPEVLGRVAAWLKPFAALPFPNRAPMNASKRRLIDASTPEWVNDLRGVLDGKDEITASDLSGTWANNISNAHLGHQMRREGFQQVRRTVAGERVRVWARSSAVVVPIG